MADTIQFNCPNCARQINIDSTSNEVVCEYCGQKSPVNGTINPPSVQTKCPVCQERDKVHKVSVLISRQDPITQHIRPPERPNIPTFRDYCITQQRYSPEPTRPQKKLDILFMILDGAVLLSFLISIIIFISSLVNQRGYNAILSAIFCISPLLILVALFSWLAFRAYKFNKFDLPLAESKYAQDLAAYNTNNENMRLEYENQAKSWVEKWQEATERWKLLCYCERDGILFIPGEVDYAPVKDILKFIYSEKK